MSRIVAVRPALALVALTLLAWSTGYGSLPHDPMSGDGVFAVPGGDEDHYRLRFTDGQVSRNDSCMIKLGNRLNPRVPPMYVNGEPLAFC